MQRTPTKTSDEGRWWWGGAAAVAIGLGLYGWLSPLAQADGESVPEASSIPPRAASSTAASASAVVFALTADASARTPNVLIDTAPPVATAASTVVRRVESISLELPAGSAPTLLPLGQSMVALVGQRPVEVAPGQTQALVALRDLQTGQLHYRLSVLRVVLKPGTAPEVLAQSLPASRLDFSNQVYTLLEVAPEQLAAAFQQLQADARVLDVSLKAYTPPARSK